MANSTLGLVETVEAFTREYVSGYAWNEQILRGTPRPELLPWTQLPFSSVWSPIIAIVVYLLGINIGERIMRDRKPFVLKRLLLVHNAFLTLMSMVIFGGLMSNATELYLQHGFHYIWRDFTWSLQDTPLQFWCYIFYVSKYYELLDTLFLILRKKPIRVVQKWHHSSVLVLFWSYNNSRMIVHYYLAVVNSFVHIFVYGFFVCATLNINVPWKNYITMLQIGQFVFAIIYSSPLPLYKLLKWQPYTGDWGPFLIGQFIGLTFIFLFWQVYYENTNNNHKKRLHKTLESDEESTHLTHTKTA